MAFKNNQKEDVFDSLLHAIFIISFEFGEDLTDYYRKTSNKRLFQYLLDATRTVMK